MRKLLLVLTLLLGTHSVSATQYYLSPTGSDAANGTTSGTPWKTFNFALPRLVPGDTLNLLNGTYTAANSGMVTMTCGSNAVNGTAGQRITVKAVNERQAHIQGVGTTSPWDVVACSYWSFQGLYLSTTDASVGCGTPGTGRDTLHIAGSNNLEFKRNLIYHTNRCTNNQTVLIDNSSFVLLEENEIYFSHRHGVALFGSSIPTTPHHNTLRRNYLHSRNAADVAGGNVSGDTAKGDTGISCYPCHDNVFENNITENWTAGMDIQAKWNNAGNRYLGNITLSTNNGLLLTARSEGGQVVGSMPQNTQVTNHVSVGASSVSGYFRANKNTHCDNCTFLGGTSSGVIADIAGGPGSITSGDNAPSIFFTNTLVVTHTGAAYSVSNQLGGQGFNFVRNFGNGTNTFPASTTNSSTSDPSMGTCKVWIPDASNLKGAGLAGADIGANVLYRYVDGILTSTPLWDTSTGAFTGCGVQVSGINDHAGDSCFDVHTRLNVNSGGCSFPSGYAVSTTVARVRGSSY